MEDVTLSVVLLALVVSSLLSLTLVSMVGMEGFDLNPIELRYG